MAKQLKAGDKVFVPRSKLGMSVDTQSAFYSTKVQQVRDRSIKVDIPGGALSDWIGSSAAHTTLGICIVRIGDLSTEPGLLDPLAKSILQYFRLLLSDDMVDLIEVRSTFELDHYWQKQHAKYSHVVLVGHGSSTSIKFGVDSSKSATEVAAVLSDPGPDPKFFISLCCETGRMGFAKAFSLSECCHSFVGPLGSVHGGLASQFCQTYFAHHLLDGRSSKVSFNIAKRGLPGGGRFICWQTGKRV